MEESVKSGEITPEMRVALEAMEKINRDKARREAEQPQEEPEVQIPEDFDDPGYHNLQDMGILARIGKGSRTFDLQGNAITLRTLKVGEELEILARTDAWPVAARSQVYVVWTTALALESINGQPYFERIPLGPKDDVYFYKFKHFINDLYPSTISILIDEYTKLRQEVQEKASYAKKE
jgi:hypothetical protein